MNKKIIISLSAILLLGVGLIWFFNQRRSDISDELETAFNEGKNPVLGSSRFSEEIRNFYTEREYMEVWLFNGTLSKQGKALLTQIEESKYDGLQPADYNLAKIYELSIDQDQANKKFRNLSADEKVTLELLLTDSFFGLARDLENGKVNPASLDKNWKFEAKKTKVDYLSLLEKVANGGSVEKTLATLYPTTDLYSRGREAIKNLYEI
ncbi:hypothetical protein [Algoriphagus sp.]